MSPPAAEVNYQISRVPIAILFGLALIASICFGFADKSAHLPFAGSVYVIAGAAVVLLCQLLFAVAYRQCRMRLDRPFSACLLCGHASGRGGTAGACPECGAPYHRGESARQLDRSLRRRVTRLGIATIVGLPVMIFLLEVRDRYEHWGSILSVFVCIGMSAWSGLRSVRILEWFEHSVRKSDPTSEKG